MPLHLDVLPVHPQPLPFESYTGYLTRLAEANDIRRINQLSVLTGLYLAEARSPSDFPNLLAYAQLPQVAVCTIDHLHETTFYYLLRKFGRTTEAIQMSKLFLNETIGSHLRYCPRCLSESGYISLLWRFLGVEACLQHGVDLVDGCGHCGQPISFLANGLRVAVCPHCQFDLRESKQEKASQEALSRTRIWHDDLVFLLQPQDTDDLNPVQHIGPQLLRRRQQAQYSLEDVAVSLHVLPRTIQGMESQTNARKGEHFIHYVEYSRWLGTSIHELFALSAKLCHEQERDRWIVIDIREQTLLERLNEVAMNLGEVFPSFKWFAAQLNVSKGQLKQYPSIRSRVKQLQALYDEQKEIRYKQLVEHARLVAQKMADAGQPVTRKALSEAAGVHYQWFSSRPEFAMLLHSFAEQRIACQVHQEQELYDKVNDAIQMLKRAQQDVTIQAISELVDVHAASLRLYHTLDELFVQAGIRKAQYLDDKSCEETDILRRLLDIEAQLTVEEIPITRHNVIERLGLSEGKVKTYPQVDAWLRQLSKKRRQEYLDQDMTYYERLPAVLETLQNTDHNVTLAAIARGLNCSSPAKLRYHLQTWQMISAFLRQQEATRKSLFQQKEDTYLEQIETILHDLQYSRQPISAQIVCDHLGMPLRSLRHCFRVRARLEQLAEDTRRQKR